MLLITLHFEGSLAILYILGSEEILGNGRLWWARHLKVHVHSHPLNTYDLQLASRMAPNIYLHYFKLF